MNLPLLFLAFGLSITAAQAQKSQHDYLVKATGDTVRGRIQQVGKHYTKVRLYQNGAAPVEFSAADATSYGSPAGIMGVSRQVGTHGPRQFVTPLVTGYVSVFSGENAQQDKRFYLQQADSAYVVEVSPLTAQLTYARQLPGCPALEFGSNKIQDQYRYNAAGVSALVMAYNRCRQPQQPTAVVKRSSGARLAVGVKAGINVSDFQLLTDPFPGTHTRSTGFQGGATFNLATRTPFSVQVEALYATLRSTYGPFENSTFNSGIPSNTNLVTIHYDQFQVPLLLRYTFGYGNLRPYVNAGGLYGTNLSNTSSLTYPIATNPPIPVSIAKTSFGYAAGGGIAMHRAGLPVMTLEVRYDHMDGTSVQGTYAHKQTSFRVDVGVSF